jgi:NADPH:quinone reductase-like Zn-dependent oxidoreductase
MDITHSNQNLGLECAGLISRIGENTKHDFQLGDFVLCWSPGSLATHVRVDVTTASSYQTAFRSAKQSHC